MIAPQYSCQCSNTLLCQAFKAIAQRTWTDLMDAFKYGLSVGEETLTDCHLLYLLRHHQNSVIVRKFDKRWEEPKTGADWEWWFTDHTNWFGMRVQAKRLDPRTVAYKGIKGPQTQRLISSAKQHKCFPAFLFYNYHHSGQLPIGINCISSALLPDQFGCTVAGAGSVAGLSSRKLAVASIGPISIPLMCLVWCLTTSVSPSATIPFIVHRMIQSTLDGGTNLPEVLSGPPEYVQRILENNASLKTADLRPDKHLRTLTVFTQSERRL